MLVDTSLWWLKSVGRHHDVRSQHITGGWLLTREGQRLARDTWEADALPIEMLAQPDEHVKVIVTLGV